MFAIADKWVWDFWLAEERGAHHLFYLQAPRALGDPERRHHHSTIGHAMSPDFCSWRLMPDALRPGEDGCWDDLAVWTGSVLRHGDRWNLLYTGVNRSERGLVQRIGLATSTDLVSWRRHGANPVLEADSRWYERLAQRRWRDESWRDPFLFQAPGEPGVQVLITARSNEAPPDGAGVIGLARSNDLVDWEVLPPLTRPGDFAQVEVPQLLRVDGRTLILFSCLAEDHSRERIARLGGARGVTGTYSFSASAGAEGYRPSDEPVATAAGEVLYAGKLVDLGAGHLGFMAFRSAGDAGFIGELTDLFPARLTDDDRVVVTTS